MNKQAQIALNKWHDGSSQTGIELNTSVFEESINQAKTSAVEKAFSSENAMTLHPSIRELIKPESNELEPKVELNESIAKLSRPSKPKKHKDVLPYHHIENMTIWKICSVHKLFEDNYQLGQYLITRDSEHIYKDRFLNGILISDFDLKENLGSLISKESLAKQVVLAEDVSAQAIIRKGRLVVPTEYKNQTKLKGHIIPK